MKRVIFDIILFILIFISPWWISSLLLIIGIFLFNDFYEFLVGAIIIYSLFSIQGNTFLSSPLFFSICIVSIFIFIKFIKNNIILYKNDFSI